MRAAIRSLTMLAVAALVGAGAGWPAAQTAGSQPPRQAAAGAQARKPPHLTARHQGWRKTECLECHEAADLAPTHKQVTLRPPACGSCHGYNGAPHEGHAIATNPCRTCHSTVEHAARFEAPANCISCHMHPKSPTGR